MAYFPFLGQFPCLTLHDNKIKEVLLIKSASVPKKKKKECLRSKMLCLWSLPFFSPVKGTKSSLSFCSKASFSRYMRRCSRSKGPVAAFCVWSFCRNPAGSMALWQDRGVSRKEDVCRPVLCYFLFHPHSLCAGEAGRIPTQNVRVSWGLGALGRLWGLTCSNVLGWQGAPNELKQCRDG